MSHEINETDPGILTGPQSIEEMIGYVRNTFPVKIENAPAEPTLAEKLELARRNHESLTDNLIVAGKQWDKVEAEFNRILRLTTDAKKIMNDLNTLVIKQERG